MRCAVCDRRGQPVCAPCSARFRPLARGQIVSDVTVGTRPVRAVYELEPGIRSVIAALKYRRERRLSRWVAEQLVPLIPRGADAITWVPATPDRVRQRGFDQAAEIARELSVRTGVPSRRLLERAGADRRQTEQDRDQRHAGPTLRNARHRGGELAELVVLLDDVVTTGASLRTASAVLARGSVERVVPVVLAATPLRAEPRARLDRLP